MGKVMISTLQNFSVQSSRMGFKLYGEFSENGATPNRATEMGAADFRNAMVIFFFKIDQSIIKAKQIVNSTDNLPISLDYLCQKNCVSR